MTTGPTAVIAGAGIGGLAAAIGLRRIGMDVRVVEQRPEPGAIGAGIALFPNAVRAFDALGVGDVVRSVAGRPFDSRHESGLRLPSGRWLVRTRPQQDEPLLACHRNDLHAALLAAVPPGVVEPATSVVGVRSWSDGVDVTLRTTAPDGGTRDQVVRADLLVGADGIGSVVRSWMWPEASARYAGYTAWRAVTVPGDWPAQGGETWGRGLRFGIVPITGGRVYWFATANLPEGSGAGLTAPQRHAEVRERFAGWHDPIPRLIAATRPDDVLQHDIGRLDPPLPSFVRGRVALLGDAAHAMTPDLGQGACQAVEDAAVLTAELARTTAAGAPGDLRGDLEGGVAAALAAYDGARRPRTQRVARTAFLIGRFAQLDGRVSTAARAGVMWLLPSAAFGGRGSGWLLDWHPPAVPRAVTAPRAVESPTAADAPDPAEASGGA